MKTIHYSLGVILIILFSTTVSYGQQLLRVPQAINTSGPANKVRIGDQGAAQIPGNNAVLEVIGTSNTQSPGSIFIGRRGWPESAKFTITGVNGPNRGLALTIEQQTTSSELALFATEKGFIGINGVNDPIAPLEVRGDNMTLTSTNPTTTPFPQLKFTGLGESNGMMGASANGCDFYGFRAQDGLDFTVNLGIEAVGGSPERPALTWNNANANQEFAFIYDDPTNTTSCGNLIASFCGTGAFQFLVEGDIKATGATFSSSDLRFKKEIRTISDALSMVSSLNGVTYKYRTEEFADKNFTDGRSYGFIAQELQKVMPEAVKEDNDGYLAVNYSAVIPVLTNAIQDQQAIIEQQDAEMDALKDRLAQIESQLNIETPSSTRKAQLMQNVPNPASSSTRISYVLPDNASKATIQVLDLKTGALVKELPLTQTERNVELSLRDLNAGMYGYTLIVDGQRVDSKLLEVSK